MGRLLKGNSCGANRPNRSALPATRKREASIEGRSIREPKKLLHELQADPIGPRLRTPDLRTLPSDVAPARERNCTVFHQSPVGYLVLGRDGVVRQANRAFARMMKCRCEDIVGKLLLDWVHESERPGLRTLGAERWRRLDGVSTEIRLVARDGVTFPARFSANRLGSGRNDVASLDEEEMLLAVSNISSEKAMECALRESEEKLRLLVDNSQDIVFIVGLDHVISFASPSWQRCLGHELPQVVGHSMRDFVHPDDIPVWEMYFSRTIERGERQSGFEHRIRHSDGSTRWHATNLAPLRDLRTGIVSSCVGNARDLSQKRWSDEENRRLQGQLHHAMKMEAIGRLTGGIAHDFNNVLTSIRCNISMALMDLTSDHPLTPLLEEVSQAADSAAGLAHRLLAFSRKQVFEPRVVHLDAIVGSLQPMLTRLLGEDVLLETHHEKALRAVKADPRQLEQIVVNLAVNARDAMPHGGRLVIETANVELERDDIPEGSDIAPGFYVLLRVADTGVGMNDEVKRHLFEPFFTTKPRGRGTGLGLATIHGTVRQAGGAISIESREGHGTVVRIYLPCTEDQAEPLASEFSDVALERGNETILLVEDDIMVRKLGTRILTRLGYQVLVAANAAEALLRAEETTHRIDLLFTDIVMPGMTGTDLAVRIRARDPRVRVLYTSGYTENVIAERGLVERGGGYLSKPYQPQTLAQAIRDALDSPVTALEHRPV